MTAGRSAIGAGRAAWSGAFLSPTRAIEIDARSGLSCCTPSRWAARSRRPWAPPCR